MGLIWIVFDRILLRFLSIDFESVLQRYVCLGNSDFCTGGCEESTSEGSAPMTSDNKGEKSAK